MIITIRVTEAAIKYLIDEYMMGEEEAGEVAQMIINLCDKSGSPTPNYQKERILLRDLRELMERHKGDVIFEDWILPPAIELRNAIEQAIGEPEGEHSELWPNLSIRDLERIIDETGKKLADYGVGGYTPEGLPNAIDDLFGKALAKYREEEDVSQAPEGEGNTPGLREFARDLLRFKEDITRKGISATLFRTLQGLERSLEKEDTRLRRAEDIIRRFATLRLPDKAIAYPTRSMIDEAIEFLAEGEKSSP